MCTCDNLGSNLQCMCWGWFYTLYRGRPPHTILVSGSQRQAPLLNTVQNSRRKFKILARKRGQHAGLLECTRLAILLHPVTAVTASSAVSAVEGTDWNGCLRLREGRFPQNSRSMYLHCFHSCRQPSPSLDTSIPNSYSTVPCF